MGNEKGKTIEELKEKVHSGLDVLSDEELQILFADAEAIANPEGDEYTEEPTPSDAPVSAESTPPVEETPKGQADLMTLVPEKFREKDEAASLAKLVKALQDSEAELTRRSQENSQLQNVVQELSRKPKEEYRPPVTPQKVDTPTPAAPEPEVEMDDLTFLDAPVANTKTIAVQVAKAVAEEIARRISVEQLRDYDTFTMRRSSFEKFRAEHPDLDSIREEFSQACALRPEWDNDPNGLPKLYELAKTLANAKGVAPAVTPAQPAPVVDVEKLKAEIRAEVEAEAVKKVRQSFLEEINKRKAAAGIVSTAPGQTPEDRIRPALKKEPLTPEEKAIQDMIDSGPQGLKELNPYNPSLVVQNASRK